MPRRGSSRDQGRTPPDAPLATRVTRSSGQQPGPPRAQPRKKRNKTSQDNNAAEQDQSKAQKKERKKRKVKARNKNKNKNSTETSNAAAVAPDTSVVIDPDNIGPNRPPRPGERQRWPVLHPYSVGKKGRYGIDMDLNGNPYEKDSAGKVKKDSDGKPILAKVQDDTV